MSEKEINMRFLLILLILVSCGKDQKKDCSDQMESLDGRPVGLIVGDSISIGYTPEMKNIFNEIQVVRNECNARGSKHGFKNIERWAAHAEEWEFCTINHGIWDLQEIHEQASSLEEYIENLRFEIDVLKRNCKKIIFANTTRIPKNTPNSRIHELEEFNQKAFDLSVEKGIHYCDLNSKSEEIKNFHINAAKENDVHYTKEGSDFLAQELSKCVNEI
jgi:hypothetical protein